jgi:hypothetical protein
MNARNVATIHLTDAESQGVFRALIEYRRLLKLSEIRDSMLITSELNAVDSVSEKLSLAFFYPPEAKDAAA